MLEKNKKMKEEKTRLREPEQLMDEPFPPLPLPEEPMQGIEPEPQPSTSGLNVPRARTPELYELEFSSSDEERPKSTGLSARTFYGGKQYTPKCMLDFEGFEDTFEGFGEEGEVPQPALQISQPEEEANTGARPKKMKLHLRKELLAKIRAQQQNEQPEEQNSTSGLGIFEIDKLLETIDKKVMCDTCGEGMTATVSKYDLDSFLVLTCDECEVEVKMPPRQLYDSKICEGTIGIIGHIIDRGDGYRSLTKLTSQMNLCSKVPEKRYYEYKNTINAATKDLYAQKEMLAAECVSKHYEEIGLPRDYDGCLNVDVSFDGTWLTRGHRSQLSAGFVIEADTGFILDHETLCKYCQRCTHIKSVFKNDAQMLAEELERHKDSGNCETNFTGKSGAMEKTMAQNMWNRSEDKNSMRYTTFIGDGDSSTHKALVDNPPYEDHPVEKEECVNHVTKRIVTRLMKLRKEHVVEIITSTGRTIKRSVLGGRNKLTQDAITSLGKYFGKAIRDNEGGTIEGMRNACLSGFLHVTSTEEDHDHSLCPKGEHSWCFYQRALVTGEDKSHDRMVLQVVLDDGEKELVKQVYDSLTTDEMMKKCLKGRTQNVNESLHSKLWHKLSKSKFYGHQTLKQAVCSTVMEHNYGYQASNVIATMPFSAKTQQQQQTDVTRDMFRHRKSSKSPAPVDKRRRIEEDDEDYGAGAH